MADKVNLTDSLKKLEEIAEWFDSQEDVDVEVGLTKVKEAARLIKDSKTRLAEIDNEFQAIEKEIVDASSDDHTEDVAAIVVEQRTARQRSSDDPINLDDIPF